MTKKLDSVRRSLFNEFNGDNLLDAKKTTRASITLKNTYIAAVVILTTAIAAFSNKVIQTLLADMSVDVLNKFNAGVEWTKANYEDLTVPLLHSLLISIFTTIIIYLDSDIPGVNPPTPFSPRKAQQIRYSMQTTNRLNYFVIIGVGVATFVFQYYK